MSSPLLVKISRDGKEIGTYEAKEAVRLLVYGTLKETDFYWHEGMTDWAPLAKLQEAEALRLSAETARKAKQVEARKVEQLGPAEAEQEARDFFAEANRLRLEKEKADNFRCHCCRGSFKDPIGGKKKIDDEISGSGLIQTFGVIMLILSILGVPSTTLGLVGSALFGLTGLMIYWGAEIRSRLPSLCPHCKSTNFSRPEKTDEQK